NIIEKLTFGFGILVIVSLLSFLVYQLVNQNRKQNPPQLIVTSTYDPKMSYYTYKVVVENIGDQTAEEANIQLSLYQDGKKVETGTINILYVPIKSEETAWLVFHTKRKPNDSLVVSSVSYVQP
ncbi:MAG TPA: hypothetical protein VFM59_04390, partial [Salinimicrobium sp.]|nr:hypothetical protein [Salinimicrobium sp.]